MTELGDDLGNAGGLAIGPEDTYPWPRSVCAPEEREPHDADRRQLQQQGVPGALDGAVGQPELGARPTGCAGRAPALLVPAAQPRHEIAHRHRLTVVEREPCRGLRPMRRRGLGNQEGATRGYGDHQLAAKGGELATAPLAAQFGLGRDLRLRTEAEHRQDPALAADAIPMRRAQRAAGLRLEDRDDLARAHRPMAAADDLDVGLPGRGSSERCRWDRIALRPEGHQHAVLDLQRRPCQRHLGQIGPLRPDPVAGPVGQAETHAWPARRGHDHPLNAARGRMILLEWRRRHDEFPAGRSSVARHTGATEGGSRYRSQRCLRFGVGPGGLCWPCRHRYDSACPSDPTS